MWSPARLWSAWPRWFLLPPVAEHPRAVPVQEAAVVLPVPAGVLKFGGQVAEVEIRSQALLVYASGLQTGIHDA